MANYKYKLSELAKKASADKAEKELGIPKSRFKVGQVTYSKDGTSKSEITDIDPETGAVKWEITQLPGFDKLYDELDDLVSTAKRTYVKTKDDKKFRDFYDEIRVIRNKVRTHLRNEYPDQYKRITRIGESELNEMVDLVHVMEPDGSLYGTGQVVGVEKDKTIVRFDGETVKRFPSNRVVPVQEEEVDEVSLSNAAGAYLTPYAFRKKGQKPNDEVYKELGFKPVKEGEKLKGPGGLGEALSYAFSEFDFIIKDDAYKAEVEAKIKKELKKVQSKPLEIPEKDLEAIIKNAENYFAKEARKEEKANRKPKKIKSTEFAQFAADYYTEEYYPDEYGKDYPDKRGNMQAIQTGYTPEQAERFRRSDVVPFLIDYDVKGNDGKTIGLYNMPDDYYTMDAEEFNKKYEVYKRREIKRRNDRLKDPDFPIEKLQDKPGGPLKLQKDFYEIRAWEFDKIYGKGGEIEDEDFDIEDYSRLGFLNEEDKIFKVGQKVTYLGNPGEITKVDKDIMDRVYYNVLYDKGTGKTKASNIYNKDGEIKAINEGDTYEKMAAKGKKAGNLKQGTVRKRLNIPKGEKIPLSKIKKEISRIKKMENPSEKNKKYLKALNLAKTLKTTTNVNEDKNPGATLGPGPKAGPDGVDDNYYVKAFKYKLVPKKNGTYVQMGSGLEVKKLF